VTGWKLFLIAAAAAAGASFAAQAAEDNSAEDNPAKAEQAPPAETAAAPKCRRATVNPVTGHTICVDPRGAPVGPQHGVGFGVEREDAAGVGLQDFALLRQAKPTRLAYDQGVPSWSTRRLMWRLTADWVR